VLPLLGSTMALEDRQLTTVILCAGGRRVSLSILLHSEAGAATPGMAKSASDDPE